MTMSAAGESSAASSSSNTTNSSTGSTIPTSSTSNVSSAASTTTTAVSKQNDKQSFDGAAFLTTLAMTVVELGITLSASYLFSRWIAKLMMKQNRNVGGEDEMDSSGLYSPDDSAAATAGGGSQVVAKLKKLLEARQESTLSAMMEEFDNGDDIDHDYNYNHDNANDSRQQQQQEEKKEEYSNDGAIEVDAETKDKQRQYHIQRLQTELQSRHISSLQSLNYLTPYELSIARNNLVDPADISVAFGDVGGMDDIKSEIYDLVVLPLLRPDLFDCESGLVNPPKGILLYGPPGTGKTMLAKAIAKESHATFINVQLSTIMNKWFGESNKLIAATFQLARKLAPSVVFIDEIDAFLSQRDGTEGSAMSSMKSEFLTLWDGLLSERERGGVVVGGGKIMTKDDDGRRRRGFSLFGNRNEEIENDYDSAPLEDESPLLPTPAVIVLGATNRPYDVDPAILRRLPRSFEIPLPPLQSRLQLLQLFLEKQSMTKEAREFLPELAKRTEGYSGSDLKEVCRAAAWEPVREMTTGASRRAVGVGSGGGNGDITDTNNGGRNSKPVLKRTSSGFPPRGSKARPVNVHDFMLAIQKVKRTGESARQFHAKEFVRGREDRASLAADISRATSNGNGKKATTKSGGRNDVHSQNGNGATRHYMASIDIQQLMAMAMAAASSMNLGDSNAGVDFPIPLEQSEDEDNPPEMSDAAGG